MVRDFHVILSDFVNLIMLSIIVRDYFSHDESLSHDLVGLRHLIVPSNGSVEGSCLMILPIFRFLVSCHCLMILSHYLVSLSCLMILPHGLAYLSRSRLMI